MSQNIYERIDQLMVRLLDLAAPQFSASESKEVQEFVDVGEYVLALETYVAIIGDEKRLQIQRSEQLCWNWQRR